MRDPSVTPGFIDDDALNQRSTLNGWFLTGDLGRFDTEGRLHYVSRKADMINRGGVKVAPAEIDEALISHPAVEQVAAFAIPHPSLGQDIAVAVVSAQRAEFDWSELQSHLTGRLAASKWPRHLFIVPELPRSALGKVLRRELTTRFQPQIQFANHSDKPKWKSAETALMAGLWAGLMNVRDLRDDVSFIDAGGDSLLGASLNAEAQHWFSREMPLDFILSPDCTPMNLIAQTAPPTPDRD